MTEAMITAEFTDSELESIAKSIYRTASHQSDWPSTMRFKVKALPPVEQRWRPAFAGSEVWQRDLWQRVEFDLCQQRYGFSDESEGEALEQVLLTAKQLIAQTLSSPVAAGAFHVEGVVNSAAEFVTDERNELSIRFAVSFATV